VSYETRNNLVKPMDLRLKAAKCRRLARSITNPNDPAIASLTVLAAGFESEANALEAMVAVAADGVEKNSSSSQNAGRPEYPDAILA
jgi:hypothetical protein